MFIVKCKVSLQGTEIPLVQSPGQVGAARTSKQFVICNAIFVF